MRIHNSAISMVISLIFVVILLTLQCNIPARHSVYMITKPSILPFDSVNYSLNTPLVIAIDGHILVVPQGFITDLASIPRVFWSFLAPNLPSFVYPSIAHDYLYSCNLKHTRFWADEVFYSLLLNENVKPWRAYSMFIAVRMFGLYHYNKESVCL